MLYNDPKLIFIHVSKTGGSSFSEHLKRYEGEYLKKRDHKFDNHKPLQLVVDSGIDIDDYTIVCIKRNTWERMVSFYLMCLPYNFPKVWGNWLAKRNSNEAVDFSSFYNYITPRTPYCEDYFHYVTINDIFPNHLQWIDFNNLESDVIKFCDSLGLPRIKEDFPKLKVRKVKYGKRQELLTDPKFIEIIGNKYQREIEHFGFEPPQIG